jgi:dTDP-4-dehydrorhamnose reductase
MRILLIGARGQLAQDLLPQLAGDEVTAVTHEELEICDRSSVQASVERTRPECIINTAAFHKVDLCEDEPQKAFAVNGGGVANLAQVAQNCGAVLVHISTDYVFDGAKRAPYVESDPLGPLSVYAASKVAGEWAVQRYCERYFLVRTCGLYGLAGSRSKQGNFVETMLKLAVGGKTLRVVADQTVTPTSTRELAQKLPALIRTRRYGFYHMTNAGQCTWYEFARAIFRLAGATPELIPVSSREFNARAQRPLYSVLDNASLRAAGLEDFRSWQRALAEFMQLRLAAAQEPATTRPSSSARRV